MGEQIPEEQLVRWDVSRLKLGAGYTFLNVLNTAQWSRNLNTSRKFLLNISFWTYIIIYSPPLCDGIFVVLNYGLLNNVVLLLTIFGIKFYPNFSSLS